MKRFILKTSQLLIVLAGLFGLHASAQTTSFAYTGAVVNYVVPAGVTNINIAARGGQGGNETMGSASGGQGAIMSGNFAVTPGQLLSVIAGGQGGTAMYVGGGGGGSFVWDNMTGSLLIAAGGGGGAGWDDVTFLGSTGTNASTTTTGVNGYTMTSGAGTAGSGGVIPTGYAGYAGGGAGWLSNGNNGSAHGCLYGSTGGLRPTMGGTGGTGGGNIGTAANGGFGGGGGGNARCGAVGGGGGGGYSGGGAGGEVTLAFTYRAGGGGGSYNAGTAQVNSVGNLGNGLVVISVIGGCTVPAAITGTMTLCSGVTTALYDATPGGTWSSSATGVASVDIYGVVTGVSGGTATITYSTGATCYSTAVVTVNSAPSGGAITGTTTVCAGLTTALSNPTATAGGAWSSSSTAVATVSSTGIVTGVAPGVAIISYSVTTACGTATATAVVTVTSSPGTISGPLALCVGSTGALSTSASGGVWSSGNIAVAPITSGGVVTAASTGTSTISYAIGSCVATAVVTVTSGPGPITGPTTVCLGSSITLSASVPGGIWTSGATSVATVGGGTGIVAGVSVGGAPITYAVGTCTVSATIGVVDNPAPIDPATPIQICVGGTAVVTDITPGGIWSSTPTSVASISSGGVISGLSSGAATISYTSAAGCAATKDITVNANPPAIGGTLSICAGSAALLTNSMAGGVWTISSPAVATIGYTSGVMLGVSAGTANVTYTISSTGCYTTAVATIGAAPGTISGPDVMCAGGATITLSNPVAGGVWSSGTTTVATVSASGVVTSGTVGTATISYTIGGCTPAMQTVTVTPGPTPIVGVLGVCKGMPSTLYDATPGGVWSSGTPAVAIISTSGVVTGIMPGTTIITYAMAGGCFVTAIVTVNPLAAIMGPDSICAGGSAYLTNIVGGGTWLSSNPAVATVGLVSGVLTSYIPGPTYIQYTLSAGCFVTKLITVVPNIPAITGPDRVCTGSVTTLGNAVSGGTWTGSNSYVATIGSTSGIMAAGHPDTVRITYTAPGVGCKAVKTITVDPQPIPVITYSGPVTHTLSTHPYYTSYQWYDSVGGMIAGASTMSLVIPVHASKNYYVMVEDINGCTGTYPYHFVASTDVGNIAHGDIRIYPNPTEEKVTITCPVKVRAVVTDISGRATLEQENAKELDLRHLAAGVYIITLYDDSGTEVTKEKLVKY